MFHGVETYETGFLCGCAKDIAIKAKGLDQATVSESGVDVRTKRRRAVNQIVFRTVFTVHGPLRNDDRRTRENDGLPAKRRKTSFCCLYRRRPSDKYVYSIYVYIYCM